MRQKEFCHYCGHRLITKFVDGRSRLYCDSCQTPLYENPIPAVCTVVVDDQSGLLLVKRSVAPKIGFWCLPGGFMELGETPEACALRELKEETGLSGRISTLLGVTTNPSQPYHTVFLARFHIHPTNGNLVPGDDASEAAFFPPGDLPPIAFESHARFIRIYYAGYTNHSDVVVTLTD